VKGVGYGALVSEAVMSGAVQLPQQLEGLPTEAALRYLWAVHSLLDFVGEPAEVIV
jgi:hypothetical protein